MERIAKMPKSEDVISKAQAAATAKEIMESVGDTIYTEGATVEEWLGADRRVPPCMDYRDEERDHEDDSPFCHPETCEPACTTMAVVLLRWLHEAHTRSRGAALSDFARCLSAG